MQARHIYYLDFELEIGPGRGREYPVTVLRSPGGEGRETMHFPFGELELENRLQALQIALLRSGGRRRKVLSPEERAVQDFGQALFDALLTRDVRSLYYESQREAARQGKGLRLKLRIQPPELAALPWEFLYDSREAEYLCLSRDTPVVRYLELPRPVRPLTVTPPLRVLGMVASPKDLERLDVAREKQRVERALKGLQAEGLVELGWLPGETWRDLQRAMRRGPWHVFHFIGHGGFDRVTDEGFVALADEEGETQRLSATQLGRLLADQRSLRLALLNSCEGARGGRRDIFSSTASILVRRGIPAVLAMQYEITDRAAIEFARTFYEALADAMPVDGAVTEARKAVSLAVNNTVEWGTPVLYMCAAGGLLFGIQEREASLAAARDTPQRVEGREVVQGWGRLYAEIQRRYDELAPRQLSWRRLAVVLLSAFVLLMVSVGGIDRLFLQSREATRQPLPVETVSPTGTATPEPTVWVPSPTVQETATVRATPVTTQVVQSVFNSAIQVMNVGNTTTDIVVSYSDGTVETVSGISPGSSTTFVQLTERHDPGWAGGATVTSLNAPIIALVNQSSVDGASYYNAFWDGATTVVLPNVMKHYFGYNSAVYVQNVGAAEANIVVDYNDGVQRVETVAPGEMVTLVQVEEEHEESWLGSALVSSDQPVVAVVNRQGEGGILQTYRGLNGGDTVLLLPLLKHDDGEVAGVLVQNLSDIDDVEFQVNYYNQDGVYVTTRGDTLPAGESVTYIEPVDALLPDVFVGSAVITASQPIVALVHHSVLPTSSAYYEAIPLGEVTSSVILPMVAKAYYGYDTEIAIQNAGAAVVGVTVDYGTETEVVSGLAPGATAFLRQADNPDLPEFFVGSATVEATGPIAVVVNQVGPGTLATYNGFYRHMAATTLHAPVVMYKYRGTKGEGREGQGNGEDGG